NGQYVIVSTSDTFQMFVSGDYGVTWAEVTYPGERTGLGVNSMAISANGQYVVGVAANDYDNIFLSSDYGMTWTVSSIAIWCCTVYLLCLPPFMHCTCALCVLCEF